MRIKFIAAMLCIGIVALSCQQDAIYEEEVTQSSAKSLSLETAGNVINYPHLYFAKGGGDDSDVIDPFENSLQWLAFISAKTILFDTEARTHFLFAIGDDNVVQINELLSGAGEGSLMNQFEREFRDVLFRYFCMELECGKPDDLTGGPVPPFNPPPPGGGVAPPDETFSNLSTVPASTRDSHAHVWQAVDDYIDFVLNLNCFELYMPTDLNFLSSPINLTSVGHPLEITPSNYGFKLHDTPIVGPKTIQEAVLVIVDPIYAAGNGNVILARPYRVAAGGAGADLCGYVEYPVNFDLFLQ